MRRPRNNNGNNNGNNNNNRSSFVNNIMLRHLNFKAIAIGFVTICMLFTTFHRAEHYTIQVDMEDLPKVMEYFQTCFLRTEPPASDRPIQQYTTKEKDASIRFKGYLMRLPEGDKPIQYLPLEFLFLMQVPIDRETVILALMGKCTSLMIVLEKDYYHIMKDKKMEYVLDLQDFINNKASLYRIKEIAFHNEKKSGHCEVKNPNFGDLPAFRPDEQYFSCPQEQMFSCRRFNLTDEEKAMKPNKFDLLVFEHLEIGLDDQAVPGGQFSKKVKRCELD